MGKKLRNALVIGGAAAFAGYAAVKTLQKRPIGKHVPFAITLNRPELRPFRDELVRGNEWVWACSPKTTENGLPSDGGDCAAGLQRLSEQALAGKTVFYHAYSEAERKADPTLERVGVYCLHSDSSEKRPYVIMAAGGGFTSVCTLFESLPVCTSFNDMGYTCFCIQYRTGKEFGKVLPEEQLMGDVSACIHFITEHADELNIEPENYLIGGFSAGGHLVSMWANERCGYERYDLPRPGAVCMIYGTNADYTGGGYDLPTFCRYCLHDKHYTSNDRFTDLAARLEADGIPNDFKSVDVAHGFGLGSNTDAEGWTKEAEAFWLGVIGTT